MSDLSWTSDDNGVSTLSIDRPDQHNALDRRLIDDLHAALDKLAPHTRVLILEGRGDSFCAGADIQWMKASRQLSDADNRADAMALSNMLDALNTFPQPTLARVQGATIGGGCGLVACCDLAIASDNAVFAFSEVRLGLTPATISPYVLSAISAREARRWFLTAERFDAHEAHRIGLIHECCPAEDLDRRVQERVKALLVGGPVAQTAAKRLIRDIAGSAITKPLREDVADRLADVRAGDEAQEGLAAFLEKRRASFRA